MITARARAMTGPTTPFSTVTIDRRDVGPADVLLDIAYAGICHTDVHHARAEFGRTTTRSSPATRSPASSGRWVPR